LLNKISETEVWGLNTASLSKDVYAVYNSKANRKRGEKMYCQDCGKENRDDANYCWNCGTELLLKTDEAEKKAEMETSNKQELCEVVINKNGKGKITPETGVHKLRAGEKIKLEAKPQEGWKFAAWKGDIPESNSPNIFLTADKSKNIIAEFKKIDSPLRIEDKALRKEIGKRVSKIKNEPIYKEDICSIKRLNLGGGKITNIKPLEEFNSLKKLNLHNNKISDISSLKDLTNLEELNLNNNNIMDISPLENLVYLKKLRLYNNHIKNLSPLKELINLEELNLNKNNITDISPLKNLNNLEKFRLYQNDISDLRPLKNLINLEVLRLDNNNITDITPIKELINLKHLYLRGNDIVSGTEIIGELVEKGVEVKV